MNTNQIIDFHIFVGKPSALFDVDNVDWVPTIDLELTRKDELPDDDSSDSLDEPVPASNGSTARLQPDGSVARTTGHRPSTNGAVNSTHDRSRSISEHSDMSTRAGSGNMECGADNSTHGRSRSISERSDMSSKAGPEDMDTGTDHSSHSRSRSISERSDMSSRAGSGNMEYGADNSTHGRSRSNSEHSDMSSKAGSEDMDTGADNSTQGRSRSISERSDFSSRAGSDHNFSSCDEMDSDDIRADLNMDRSDLPENSTSLPTDQQQSNPSILASKQQEDEAVASSSRKGNCNVQEGGLLLTVLLFIYFCTDFNFNFRCLLSRKNFPAVL